MRRRLACFFMVSAALVPFGAGADWLNPPAGPALEGASRPATAAPSRREAAPLHQAAASPRPAVASPSLQEAAQRFIRAYWDAVSDSPRLVLDYLNSRYAPLVDYYGKPTGKAAILKDKERYLHRWPERSSWPSAGDAKISCDEATAECLIEGVREFRNADPGRDTRATGRFDYAYRIRFRNGRGQIVAEKSAVLAGR